MNRQRFETLAEAFGGDAARWPTAEREAAAALMAAEPEWARVVLADAGDLDALLVSDAPSRSSAALVDRIVAGAPRVQTARWKRWLLPAGVGAGLAAACAAGLVAGAQLTAAQLLTNDAEPMMTALSEDDFSLDFDEETG